MSLTIFLLLGLVILAGAFVQRVIGFGLNVVAAPLVVAVAPHVVPAALLITVLPLPLMEVLRGYRHVRIAPVKWALIGRLCTTPVGVWVVTVASADVISLVIAGMVLIAVVLSLLTVHVRPTNPRALAAGMITGVSATAASIGGPFVALVLQDLPPRVVRATMGPFFAVGTTVSLAGLALTGHVASDSVRSGLGWLPFVALGSLIAQPVRRRIDPGPFRLGVLALASAAAVAVAIRVLA